MKPIRSLMLLVLIGLVAYILCEDAGIAKTFNEKFTPVVQAEKSYTKTVYEHSVTVSLMRKEKQKGVKIMEGAIKKRALDAMDYIGTSTLIFDGEPSEQSLRSILEQLAIKVGSNVVIINSREKYKKTMMVSPIEGMEGETWNKKK